MTDKAQIVQFIQTEHQTGDGSIDDPHRTVTRIWGAKGDMIVEIDPDRQLSAKEQILSDALREALIGWQRHVPVGDVTDTPELDPERLRIAQLARLVE